MTFLRRSLFAFSFVAAISLAASAALAGSSTISVKDGAGATKTYAVTTDGSSNFLARNVICDQNAGANCVTVDANHGLQVAPGDGTNAMAFKAASTGAVAADKSGVVQESPNSQLSVAIGTTADAACGTATGTCSVIALHKFLNTAASNGTGLTGAAPPATAIYFGANTGGATGGLQQGLIQCNQHVFKHITTATDTVLVQGVASQTIYGCGWRSRAAGTATWYLENTASANNNCSSTLTQITGVATEAANTGEVALSPFWNGFKNTAGNGVCINSTGTGGVDIDFWFAQF